MLKVEKNEQGSIGLGFKTTEGEAEADVDTGTDTMYTIEYPEYNEQLANNGKFPPIDIAKVIELNDDGNEVIKKLELINVLFKIDIPGLLMFASALDKVMETPS